MGKVGSGHRQRYPGSGTAHDFNSLACTQTPIHRLSPLVPEALLIHHRQSMSFTIPLILTSQVGSAATRRQTKWSGDDTLYNQALTHFRLCGVLDDKVRAFTSIPSLPLPRAAGFLCDHAALSLANTHRHPLTYRYADSSHETKNGVTNKLS
jgi:hypothetical protein